MKNQLFKRLLALAVAMVMVLGMLPELHLHAHAEGEEEVTAPQSEDWCGNPLCSQEDNVHVTSCAQYVAPENPVCYCVEKCAEPNIWCDVCGFDYTQCGGTDRSAGYGTGWELEGTTLKVTGHLTALPEGVEYSKIEVHEGGNLDLGEATVTCDVDNDFGTISSGTFNTTNIVSNYSIISGGTFHDDVNNEYGATISGGTFTKEVRNDGTISGGDFISRVINKGTITGGTIWYGTVTNKESGTISNAKFESNAKLAEGSTPPQSVIHSVNGEDVALTYNAALPAALGDANAWYQGDTQVTSGTVPLNYTTYVGEYAVNTAAATNGTVSVPATAKYGQTVTVTATAFEGYVLDTVTVQQGETAVTVTDNAFTMPAGAVTVTATFSADMSGIQPGYYLVGILNGENKWEVDSSASTRLLREDPGTAGQYYLNYSFSDGDKVKIAYFDGTTITQLFQADGKEAYTIGTAKAGTVKILFRPEGNDSWSYTYFAVTPAYNVTVNTVENGTVSTDKAVATNGETVTLTVTPAEGYELVKLEVVAGSGSVDLDEENYTFTMPNQNVTVTAYFQSLGKRTVYFDNSAAQWSQVNIFFWSDSNSQMISWPGVGMIKAEGNIYSCQIPADAEHVIFNNGSSKTNDQILGDKNCCKGNVSGSTWYTYPCEHTYENGTCTVCGKACEHTSTGENVATCAKAAICDTCGVSYGEVDTTNHDSSVAYDSNGFCENGCYEPAVLVDGVYQISNAGQLYWFAAKVNGGETDIDGKLMKDIVVNPGTFAADGTYTPKNGETVREWIIIGYYVSSTDLKEYSGSFDGCGHTVSGLYFDNKDILYAGLFCSVTPAGEVQNVGVVNSYFCGAKYVGGVAGCSEGTLTNCYNTGTVNGTNNVGGVVGHNSGTVTGCYNTGTVSGTRDVGGVVGYNSDSGTITDCHNTGAVSGKYTVGGVAGSGGRSTQGCYNTGTVSGIDEVGGVVGCLIGNAILEGCYNTGTVSGTTTVGGVAGYLMGNAILVGCYNTGTVNGTNNVGGVVGWNQAGTCTNCYFDSTVYTGDAIGTNEGTTTNVEGKSTEQFASGEVAYLLSQGEKGDIWGQTIGTDPAPIFSDAKVYYGYRSCGDTEADYTNASSVSAEKPAHTQQPTYTDNRNGTHSAVYPCCGTTVTEDHTGGTATCTTLAVCDICKTAYGELAEHTLDAATGSCRYGCGKFMAVASLTNGETVTYYSHADEAFAAVMVAEGGVVTILKDAEINEDHATYLHPVSLVVEDGVTLTLNNNNLYVTEKLSGTGTITANGNYEVSTYLDGEIHDITIQCMLHNGATIYSGTFNGKVRGNYGTISGGTFYKDVLNRMDGEISGGVFHGAVNNRGGKITGGTFNGQLINENVVQMESMEVESYGTIINTTPGSFVLGDDFTIVNRNGIINCTAHIWKDGVCRLCAEACDHTGGTATCTTLAVCDTCGVSYGEVDKTNHDETVAYVNGFCPYCDAYEPAVLVDGVYQISNAGNLYWFADKVTNENAAYGSADAILTADITVNENVLATDGTANAGTFRVWTPIGKIELVGNQVVRYPYTGTFEGNGKTVSGLYFNDTSTMLDVGLFSLVGEGGTVQNVGIADSYLCGGRSIGAVAGTNYGSVTGCYNTGTVISSGTAGGVVGGNSGTVTNCYNTGTVSGTSHVGGVVGGNSGTVTGCYNTGTVSGTSDVGGVVGSSLGEINYNGVVTDCHNTGTVSGTSDVGGVVGSNSGTATNCYNSDTVSGETNVGGVVGSGNASNCYNTGTVSGTSDVGGVVGNCMGEASVMGCYNTGTVSGTTNVGGVAGYNSATVTNCYFDSTVYTGDAIGTNEGTATDVEGKSTEQFASGEVAYLLSQGEKGDIWGQTIGTDPAPIFSDAKVYYGYTSCGDTAAKYTNDSSASAEKPEHTQNPTYTDNHNGTHSAVYPCCGTTVSPKPHAMDAATGKCVCGLEMAEASVTIGGATTHYEILHEAIQAVSTATAADNAQVKLLKSIDLGDAEQYVSSGEFTLDLNGQTLSSNNTNSALRILNATVTITDNLGGGEIKGKTYGVDTRYSTLTIMNATITATGEGCIGLYANNCTAVTIKGATISGASQGVNVTDCTVLTITDAAITATGKYGYGMNATSCNVLTITDTAITAAGEDGYSVNASACAEVTIEGGTFSGGFLGVRVDGGNLTITDAEITSDSEYGYGVEVYECAEMTIEGGTIRANGASGVGVNLYKCTNATMKGTDITANGTEGRGVQSETCTLTIQDSAVTATEAVCSRGSEIRISGGSITGSSYDLVGTVKLMLPASGTGTTFPGGITVTNADLDSILGEGAAYWQGSKMIVPEDGQRKITGGDVTIQKACDHQGNTNVPFADNGDGTHSLTCSVCYATFTEEHTQPLAYVNLEDEGHKAFYPCCQKAEDVAVSDHEYEGGYCACEDEQEFTLSFYANPDDQLPVATFSVPYGTELTMWEFDEDDNETFLGATAYLENLISQITTVPQKEHYTFSGWDLEYGPDEMFGDESIYGLWTPVSYNITWDLAGGYADYPDELITTMRYNEGMILFTDFHKEGHTFSHLVDQNGLEFTREWRSDHWSVDPLMPGYDLTLTAVWDVNAYALHAQDQVLDVDYGTNPEDALAGITPEKTGYTHTGWKFYVDEGCTKEYTGTTMPAMELYAQPVFTPIEYNITWDMAGCSYYVSNYNGLPMKLAYNVDGNAHSVNFAELTAPEGYEFVRFEDGDGNALSYVITDKYRLNLTVSGDMTVKAVIEPKTYMATWTSVDGGGYEKEFKYGEVITIPNSEIFQETFRKAGHTLTGWEGYTEGMTMPIDGVTFTAVYAVNPYTITFDSDGGTAVAPITQDYGTAITAPSAPTKDGFHFSTWDPAIPETMPSEDTTLTAIWEAHKDYTYTASGDTITAFCGVCHQVVGTAKLHVTGKTYDATPVTATVTCTMEGVDAPQITYSGNINAGTYTASITLGDATAKADFTITPAVVTARAEAASKIYGQGDPALNCTIQGLIGTDALSGSLSRASGENAGSYAITVGTLANDNYIIDFIPANLTILPKTITVKADAVSKVYGQADPEFTYQAEGLVNGDKLTGELKREAGEDAGTYAITLGTLANSNYAIQFTGDKLTVTKAQQTITLDTGDVSLACGKSLEKAAQAEGAVTYSSSDASIVKVDASGKLTALKPGTVTITVKAAETGNYLPAQATYTVTVSHGHTAAVTAPTCEVKGYTTYTCPCGDSYVADYTDALGHNYKGKVTLDATCTAEGVMTYTCENDASHSYTEVIPMNDHSPKAAVEENRVEATCTEKGSYEMVTYCDACGKELDRTQHTIDATGHDYDDGVITTQPGCETEGVKTFTCANDKNHTYTEKVAPTGHSPKAAVEENRVEATCTEKGSYELATYCGVCGKELGRTQHEIPAKGHSFGSWTVVKAATCTEKGLERRDCSNCDHYETRATAFTGHSYRDAMDPSCEVCGEHRAVYVESIPMLRLYNPVTGEHHYTGSAQERDTLVSLGWNYEGVAWNAPVEFGDPVCRYYNPNTGDHHYTMCGIEGDNLVDEGWIYEGVAWNSASSEHLPIYRLYNPNAEIGAHHYTGSAEERDNLVAEGWKYEGIGWYALLY